MMRVNPRRAAGTGTDSKSITVNEAVRSYPMEGRMFEGGKSFYVLADNQARCYGCAYCVLSGVDYLRESRKSMMPAFREVKLGIVPGEHHDAMKTIPVAVNNAYGDPGMQWNNTLEKLTSLEENGHLGPVGIITKSGLSREQAAQLRRHDLNLIVLQSVSKLPGIIEPVLYRKRIESIQNLADEDVPVLLYIRPIIPGFNDSSSSISSIMSDGANAGARTAVYSGLMGTPDVLELLERNIMMKIDPPNGYSRWQSDHKLIAADTRKLIEETAASYGIHIFKKTSCGVSNALGLPADYNAHFARPMKYGCGDCIKNQGCSQYAALNDTSKASTALEVLGATGAVTMSEQEGECNLDKICEQACSSCSISKGTKLHLEGTYTLGEIGLARWISKMTVTADTMLPTNRILIYDEQHTDRYHKASGG